ncbi:MAG: hypothetical protein MUP80_02080 [Acidobacteriia bacterium]|nr:hypothetical protein [Terriglobia bacterium]
MRRKSNTLAKVAGFLALPIPDVELLVASMANPDSGIRFVLGIKKLAKGARKGISEVQSVIFDKLKWTADAASQWLKDHNFTSGGKDEGATFWRFRQKEPKGYKSFKTIIPGMSQNPGTLRGFRLYSYRDRQYRGGLFETWEQTSDYGIYIGLAPGEYEVRPGTGERYDKIRFPDARANTNRSSAHGNPMHTVTGPHGTLVRIWEQGGRFLSTLWVNGGETITGKRATHSTLAGAKRWAAKVIQGHIGCEGYSNPYPEESGGITRFTLGEGGGRLLQYVVTVGDRVVFQSNNHHEAQLKRDARILDGEDTVLWHRGRPGASYLKSVEYQAENPTPGETIPESLSGHLALTSDPSFRAQPPAIQAAMMTGMDFAERLKNNPDLGDLELALSRAIAAGNKTEARKISRQMTKRLKELDRGMRRNPGGIAGRNKIMRAMSELGMSSMEGTTNDHYAIQLAMAVAELEVETTPDEVFSALATFDAAQFVNRLRSKVESLPTDVAGYKVSAENALYQTTQTIKPYYIAEALAHTVSAQHAGRWKSRREHAKAVLSLISKLSRGGRRNPEPQAAALYEDFHGKPPGETLEIVTEKHEHDWLVQLGVLVELKVATVSNLDALIRFTGKDAPQLCSSEDGRQLYIEGGDQALDLEKLRMSGKKWEKDSMVLGVLYELTYQTQKGFQRFKLTDYFHKMGDESGVQPSLLYSPRDKLLSVSGGQYEVKPEGIVN